ncbi:MAG: ABC transporter substrate-binding protein [Chloroflexi bacterium]|nr:ABC transporter substrate-binding protein [Chloroflexota bacterium]
MKKKVIWMAVSGWTVFTLLLSACAPAVVEEEKVVPTEEVVTPKAEVVPREVVVPQAETNLVKWTGTKWDGTVVEKMLEKPKYGGTYKYARDREPSEWDGVDTPSTWNVEPVIETLSIRDWARGPGGTGEYDPYFNMAIPINEDRGGLATGWEVVDDSTLIWHIRQGVRWALDPTNEASRLVGGREFTAEDALFALRRGYAPGRYFRNRAAYLTDMKNPENSIYIHPQDPWAVVIKTEPGMVGLAWESVGANSAQMYPPEVVAKYGAVNDWRNVVGTGPFVLKDYVSASSITYVRNASYWDTDVFFPENRLPYLDGIRVYIIVDRSTMAAALRTGKIDSVFDFDIEEAKSLTKTTPQLESQSYVGSGYNRIAMRMDDPGLPWADIRVRQALMMAIDYKAMRDNLYLGEADILKYPTYPVAEYADIYVPLEKQPEIVQKMFGYHPDEARQLLAAAGYPNGFVTEVVAWSTPQADELSVVKDYWAKIGVDLKIDIRDFVTYTKMGRLPITYKHMYKTEGSAANVFSLGAVRKGHPANNGNVYDKRVEEAFEAMMEAYFDPSVQRPIAREISPYLNEQAYHIQLPEPRAYSLWWPWLKGYYGAHYISRLSTFRHPRHVWLDQELKKAMGY